jgi:bacteriocin-like protein
METNFENQELYVLDENEMSEIYGGAHIEYKDGVIIWVQD